MAKKVILLYQGLDRRRRDEGDSLSYRRDVGGSVNKTIAGKSVLDEVCFCFCLILTITSNHQVVSSNEGTRKLTGVLLLHIWRLGYEWHGW